MNTLSIILLGTLAYIVSSQKRAKCELSSNGNSTGVSGLVYFTQITEADAVLVNVTIKGARINSTNGFHIHEKALEANADCQSTGGHYNPTNSSHGDRLSLVRHVGDLGNLSVDPLNPAAGINTSFTDKIISLYGNYSIIGKPCVVHEMTDDLGLGPNPQSLINGNAGSRLACGNVIEIPYSSASMFKAGVLGFGFLIMIILN